MKTSMPISSIAEPIFNQSILYSRRNEPDEMFQKKKSPDVRGFLIVTKWLEA
jgi:hypothetical protein